MRAIAIDATVLVAAMSCPGGSCARLLQLAALGLFKPVITLEVLAEAERRALAGVGGRAATDQELLAFRSAIAGLLEGGGSWADCSWICKAGGGEPPLVAPATLLTWLNQGGREFAV